MSLDAILPAGGRLSSDFAAMVGTDVKALIRFGEETILDRTIRVLRESGQVRNVAVIGPTDRLRGVDAESILPEADTGPNNIRLGLDYLEKLPGGPTDQILIVTTDLPFLTPEIITDFLRRCPAGKDICVPVIRKSEYGARFPGSTATFIPLKDDTWTAGCAYRLDPRALRQAMPHIDRIFVNRKSKLGMARLLGLPFLLKVITKSLTVPELEAKIGSLVGCTGAAVMGCAPELAYDIDATDDYEYAISHLRTSP